MVDKKITFIIGFFVLLFLGLIVFSLYPIYTETVLPEIPKTEKSIDDKTINYGDVRSLKFTLLTSCNVQPICSDHDINVYAGSYKLLTFNPIECTDNLPSVITKSFEVNIDGSLLKGNKLSSSGGCSEVSLKDVRVVEVKECLVDNDCSFTKTSQLIRTSTGKCKENKCFYGVVPDSSEKQLTKEDVKEQIVLEKTGTKNRTQLIVGILLVLFLLVGLIMVVYRVVRK